MTKTLRRALSVFACVILAAFVACVASAPVLAQGIDANTLLLLRCENSLNGEQGETPTQASGVTFQAGMQGQGASFGNPNQVFYASANNINAPEGTVEFWIRPNWSGSDNATHNMVLWGGGGGMLIAKDGGNYLRIILNRYGVFPGGELGVSTNISAWQPSQWHHVAFTYSNAQKKLRVFVDGAQKAESAFTATLPAITNSSFQIGGDGQGGYVDSVLDEMRISSVARTPQEITASYLDGLTLYSLTIAPTSLTLIQGTSSTPQLSADSNVGTVSIPPSAATWTSSNTAVASVNNSGSITGVGHGTATITATVKTLQAALTVTVNPPVRAPEFDAIDPFLSAPANGALHEIPVVVINYLPTTDGVNVDSTVSGWSGSINTLKSNITLFNKRSKFMLEEGSRYRGYQNPGEVPSVGYRVVAIISVYENIPRSNFEVPWNPGIYRPDYNQILTRFDARHYIEDLGVKEVWMWGYHYKDIEPIESDMASALTGDISNSERTSNDLPIFNKTYTLYNYNFATSEANAVHDHGHQLEAILSYANNRQDGNTTLFGQKFVGNDPVSGFVPGRCGDTHHPPNAAADYDYANSTPVNSDIEDWTPAGTGQKKPMSASVWSGMPYVWPTGLRPGNTTEDHWYIYWMQNMPGYGNTIKNGTDNMSNWWEFTGDWDGSITRGLGLYIKAPSLSVSDVSLNEGNSRATNATFTVTRSGDTSFTVTVNYATANGSATAGSDYTSKSGLLTFSAGQTTKTIAVPVTGDFLNETNETFFVNLSGANVALADNQGTGTIVNDDFDTTLPTVSFTTSATTPTGTTPINGSTIYSAMPAITGVAADAGSGIAKVTLRLYRATATAGVYEYWNGSAWTTTSFNLTTVLTVVSGSANVTWKRSGVWPSGTAFTNGTYYLRANAYDKANNVAPSAGFNFKKATDTTVPTVSFTTSATTPTGTTPMSGSTITGNMPAITGVAADAGSGIAKVTLRLYRATATAGVYEYWNGSAWTTTSFNLTTVLTLVSGSASVTWQRSGVWPSGTTFTNGTYYLRANAYDKAGNVAASPGFNFKKASAAISATTASSPQAIAQVSASSVVLQFSGAVPDGDFTVAVNGKAVAVQSIERADNSVTLLLPDGALHAGDAVFVTWDGGTTQTIAE